MLLGCVLGAIWDAHRTTNDDEHCGKRNVAMKMNEECFRREGQTIALQWYKSCVWVHPLEKYTCECIDLEYTIAKLYVICEAFLFIYLSCNVIFSPSFLHSFCLIDRVVEDCKHSDWGFFCVVGWNGEFLSDVLRSLHPQFTCEECIFSRWAHFISKKYQNDECALKVKIL